MGDITRSELCFVEDKTATRGLVPGDNSDSVSCDADGDDGSTPCAVSTAV